MLPFFPLKKFYCDKPFTIASQERNPAASHATGGVDKCALKAVSSFRRRPESNDFSRFRTSRTTGGDAYATFFDTPTMRGEKYETGVTAHASTHRRAEREAAVQTGGQRPYGRGPESPAPAFSSVEKGKLVAVFQAEEWKTWSPGPVRTLFRYDPDGCPRSFARWPDPGRCPFPWW
jgi:hypothetical protein